MCVSVSECASVCVFLFFKSLFVLHLINKLKLITHIVNRYSGAGTTLTVLQFPADVLQLYSDIYMCEKA